MIRFCKVLSSGEDWAKPGFSEKTGDRLTLIALDLDPSLFNRSSRSADFLHLFGESLFFRLADSDKPCHHRHSFPTTVRCLAKDIHTASVFLGSIRDGSSLVA